MKSLPFFLVFLFLSVLSQAASFGLADNAHYSIYPPAGVEVSIPHLPYAVYFICYTGEACGAATYCALLRAGENEELKASVWHLGVFSPINTANSTKYFVNNYYH